MCRFECVSVKSWLVPHHEEGHMPLCMEVLEQHHIFGTWADPARLAIGGCPLAADLARAKGPELASRACHHPQPRQGLGWARRQRQASPSPCLSPSACAARRSGHSSPAHDRRPRPTTDARPLSWHCATPARRRAPSVRGRPQTRTISVNCWTTLVVIEVR